MSVISILRSLITIGQGALRGMSEEEAGSDPLALFGRWLEDARRARLYLYEAVCLATATPDGKPSARMMLLKGFNEDGFRFFSNYDSRKSEELAQNDRASLVFHWPVLHRQVRVEGTVRRVSAEESAEYFRTRPRGSQLGAWASRQSAPLKDRSELERQFHEQEEKFDDADVPLPPFWGGYRLKPARIEFWQGRANRLHDRLVYMRTDGGWDRVRLSP